VPRQVSGFSLNCYCFLVELLGRKILKFWEQNIFEDLALAGRSPALKARRAVQQRNSAMSPQLSSAPPNAPLNESAISPLSQVAGARTPTGNQPIRKNSARNGRLNAPPIPDADGFIPMSTARNRNSFYDNVTPSGKHT
jgi:hypothetical protein